MTGRWHRVVKNGGDRGRLEEEARGGGCAHARNRNLVGECHVVVVEDELVVGCVSWSLLLVSSIDLK